MKTIDLPDFFKESPMKVFVVDSKEEALAKEAEMLAIDFKWAATSNTGLPKGKMRITFMHKSTFKKEAEIERPKGSMSLIDWKVLIDHGIKDAEASEIARKLLKARESRTEEVLEKLKQDFSGEELETAKRILKIV